jgi:hypothetical protein
MVAGLSLLIARGILLWIAIPLGFVGWVILTPWLRAPGITLGQFLGWIDINLIAALERGVLRPLFRHPQPWTSARDIAKVRHRIGKLDLY